MTTEVSTSPSGRRHIHSTELDPPPTKVELETEEAIARGWLEEAGAKDGKPLYRLTQAGVLRSAIKQVIQGYHAGRGYGRSIDFLEQVLMTTEQDYAPDA